ncbi:uncharacterized protein METZ01_LOCUS32810 [marine metagenome]|uniref:Uncharacterized protein n=1 Tax=marine metagenome TaxID=408172 RepID=A0A381QKS0_9ZZZZ
MDDTLRSLIPEDMEVPRLRLNFSTSNLSWLCRNLQINNKQHPEIKQTMAKLNTLRMKLLFNKENQWRKVN